MNRSNINPFACMSGSEIDRAAMKMLDDKMKVVDDNWRTTIDEMKAIARKQHGGVTPPYEHIRSNEQLYALLASRSRSYIERHKGMTFKSMLPKAVADIVLENVPLALFPSEKIEARTPQALRNAYGDVPGDYEQYVYTYNFNLGIYVPLANRIKSYVSAVKDGSISEKLVSDVLVSMLVEEVVTKYLLPWNPPPTWLVPVGNGVLNLVTNELEQSSVYVTVAERITTDYFPEAASAEFFTSESRQEGRAFTYARLADDLANHEPERRRLIDEICKAAVTREYGSTQAIFVFAGKGGDGKSLFVEHAIGGMLGGSSNVANLDLSALSNNSQLCTADGKMAIIGSDNSADLRIISSSNRFKRLAEHRPITIDNKYEKARAISLSGICIQCFNELPKFSSKEKDAIARRIVMVRSDNRLNKNKKNDDGLEALVDEVEPDLASGRKYTFRQHMLASVVALPYYRGFNPCDSRVIRDHLNDDDALGQFVSALASDTSVLDESVLAVPITHLYAAYRDWMAANMQQNTPLAAKSFTSDITSRLEAYGFVRSTERVNPTHRRIAETYSPELFGEYANGQSLSDAVSANRLSYYLVRDEGIDPSTVVDMSDSAKSDYPCSLAEYTRATSKVLPFLDEEELALYDVYNARQILRGRGIDPDNPDPDNPDPHNLDPRDPDSDDPTPPEHTTPVLDALRANSAASGHIPPETYESAADEVRSLAEPSTDPDAVPAPPPVLTKLKVVLSNRGTNGMTGELRRIEAVSPPTVADCARLLGELADIARKYPPTNKSKPPSKIPKETP